MIAFLPHPIEGAIGADGEVVRVLGLWVDPKGGDDQWLVVSADGTPRYETFAAVRLGIVRVIV